MGTFVVLILVCVLFGMLATALIWLFFWLVGVFRPPSIVEDLLGALRAPRHWIVSPVDVLRELPVAASIGGISLVGALPEAISLLSEALWRFVGRPTKRYYPARPLIGMHWTGSTLGEGELRIMLAYYFHHERPEVVVEPDLEFRPQLRVIAPRLSMEKGQGDELQGTNLQVNKECWCPTA